MKRNKFYLVLCNVLLYFYAHFMLFYSYNNQNEKKIILCVSNSFINDLNKINNKYHYQFFYQKKQI